MWWGLELMIRNYQSPGGGKSQQQTEKSVVGTGMDAHFHDLVSTQTNSKEKKLFCAHLLLLICEINFKSNKKY